MVVFYENDVVVISTRSLQAHCNEFARHFQIYFLKNWVDLNETWQRDIVGMGKSDSLNFSAKLLSGNPKKAQNTKLFVS